MRSFDRSELHYHHLLLPDPSRLAEHRHDEGSEEEVLVPVIDMLEFIVGITIFIPVSLVLAIFVASVFFKWGGK